MRISLFTAANRRVRECERGLCPDAGGKLAVGRTEGGIKIGPDISTKHFAIDGTWSNGCGTGSFGSAC